MNEIINWVAQNNVILIRVGFSAVIILLLFYAFRLFFVPSLNELSNLSDNTKSSGGSSQEMMAL